MRTTPAIPIARIIEVVAGAWGVPPSAIRGSAQHREFCEPRHVAMYLARRLTPASLPQIGRIFGSRHHTSVLHAVRSVEASRAVNPELNRKLEELAVQITAGIQPPPRTVDELQLRLESLRLTADRALVSLHAIADQAAQLQAQLAVVRG